MGKQVKFGKLVGILDKVSEKKIVIVCHGLGGSKGSGGIIMISKILKEKGISVFRFDFTGHGDSENGEISIKQCIKDLQKALDFVKSKGFEEIIIEGSSYSGVVTLAVAAKNELKAIVLKSPVINYKEFGEDIKKDDDVNGYDFADKIKVPCLIIHGDKDESVPVEQSLKLHKLIKNSDLKIMKGANHRYENCFDEMIDYISKWLIKRFK